MAKTLCIIIYMKNKQQRQRSSAIFLILGLAFLTTGIATNQTAFTWIAIAFVLISLIAGGKWLKFRK
jgi:uncharacterized membrane protein YdbT with pleckstrin-like domain